MQQQWPADKIERRKVADLIPYARNARTHSDAQIAQIAASIKEWGWTTPVLIDQDGGIIAGHGRVMAARKLGLNEIPTMTAVGWSDAQKKAYIIADNQLALNAGWDMDLLKVEMMDLDGEGFDLSLIGFDDDMTANLLNDPEEGLTDPDAVPELTDDPVTVEGDVWVMGPHRLMCGDSTSIDALEALCGEHRADMWLTDPPYNVDYEGSDGKKIKNDNMDDVVFRQFLVDAFSAAFSVMKPGGSFYIWHADTEGYNFRGAVQDCGEQVRSCLIWRKPSIVMGRSDYHWQHEPCLYGWKSGASHLWASDRKQSTILEFNKPRHNDVHPTMKPVELFEYQMLNNTKGGYVVLDSFGGSGTTLIAAEKNGRVARLMELDPKYCDVIIKRWQDFTGQQAIHEATGKLFSELEKDGREKAA
jgi:DNA modification methylase